MNLTVPLFTPRFTPADKNQLLKVLHSGWLTHGPFNEKFETDFARYLDVNHAVSVNSCASALLVSLIAHKIKGEVIIPSFTFVATANAVVNAGATPVFVDVSYDTCNINPQAINASITKRTEAIIPVHFGGQSAPMKPIMALAQKHKLVVIEDSAETIGGLYQGKKTGSFGTGCFSFYPTKNLTTGEGGMVTTNSTRLASIIRTYAAHGITTTAFIRQQTKQPWLRTATVAGYNFRMSGLQAGLGISQLKRLDTMNRTRRRLASWYTRRLKNIEEIDVPVESPNCYHVYQMYTIKVKKVDRTKFLAKLRQRGIDATVHFDPPVHKQLFYKKFCDHRTDLSVTNRLSRNIVPLPLFPAMTQQQQVYVVNNIKAAIKVSRSS
ncbi:hypothetical protein A2783_02890 [Microgenomates group bacterium RIFCSPHIGHO2_01_FULL_45_11]|nr:MAG: hypothetical protein A2783_02890 [Microgenomates group bacterium RIFCSPHIGHO2_01_FULL_45_11]